jgi:hypothetical protein
MEKRSGNAHCLQYGKSMKRAGLSGRILRSVGGRSGEVVLRRDFEGWASPSQITRALQTLQARGALVRIGYGVYAKARPSGLSGQPVPRQPLEFLAIEALRRLGVPAEQGVSSRAYADGESLQIPMQPVINTDGVRFARRLSVGRRTVRYERNQRRAA